MTKCEYYKNYCECFDALENDICCILHSKNENKDKNEFKKFLENYIEKNSDKKRLNLSNILFVSDLIYTGIEFNQEID